MARDLIGGLAAILIGAGYLALALQIRASALSDTVGPAGFPKLLAAIMIGLGVILCGRALIATRRRMAASPVAVGGPAEAAAEADSESEFSGLGGLARAAGMLAIGIAYLLIVRVVGYVPAVAALIVAAALYGGAVLSWRVFAIGIAGAVLYWLVFVLFLGIPLPGGPLADLF
jgi:putative tricarboxylic transport membrane protein